MLVALCEGSPERLEALAAQGHPITDIPPPQRPFKFAILSCGHKGTDEFYDGFYNPRLTTPLYFDIGTYDHMIKTSLSEAWVQVSHTTEVKIRNGGHWFPTSEADARAMAGFAAEHVVEDGRSRSIGDSSAEGGSVVVRTDSACAIKGVGLVGWGSRSS